MNQLIAYVIDGHELRIRPAPVEREWMDDSDQRFAYRCLPLNIANAHGWEILCTPGFFGHLGRPDKYRCDPHQGKARDNGRLRSAISAAGS